MPPAHRRHALSTAVAFLTIAASGWARGQPPEDEPPQTPEASQPEAPSPAPPEPEAPAPAPPPSPPPPPPAAASEPLAGVSDGTIFLRSPDGYFQLLPNGRLQVDSYFYKSDLKVPNNTALVRRARAEVAGWVGTFFFSLAGDFAIGPPAAANPAAPANLATTDDYLAVAPWGNLLVVQFGQYDAPFTLENRTSDKYFDFIERSLAVRAFGIPSNKEVGLMAHGLLPQSLAYYSVAVVDGDGQNFRNVDSKFDVMGRFWLSLLPTALQSMATVRAGGSFWLGTRKAGLPLAGLSTEGGYAFWSPRWNGPMATPGPFELHQDGDLRAFAGELDANVGHRGGLRVEWVQKDQHLEVADVSKPGSLTAVGHGKVNGGAGYAELWFWPVGDDLMIGEPGLQLPPRVKKFGTAPPRLGVMLALRLEYLGEEVSGDGTDQGSPLLGTTKVTALVLGANVWFTKRIRLSVNYGAYHLFGDARTITALPASGVQELLFRWALAL